MQIERRVVLDEPERAALADAFLHLPLPTPPDALTGWIPTTASGAWVDAVVRVLRGDGRSPKGRLFREAGMGAVDIEALHAALSEGQAYLEKNPMLFPMLENQARLALGAGLDVVLAARTHTA